MEKTQVKETVREFLLREFLPGEDPAELTDETPLISGAILDSISTLKLVVFLEEQFEVVVDAYEAGPEHLDNLDRIATLIDRKTRAA